jgi:hypothetical protein
LFWQKSFLSKRLYQQRWFSIRWLTQFLSPWHDTYVKFNFIFVPSGYWNSAVRIVNRKRCVRIDIMRF